MENPLEVFIQITEDFNNIKSLSILVQASEDAAFINAKPIIEQSTVKENLKAGSVSNLKFLLNTKYDYIRLLYTITGDTPAWGSVSAYIVK